MEAEFAAQYLMEMSTGITYVAILDSEKRPIASTGNGGPDRAAEILTLARELAGAKEDRLDGVEVSNGAETVFVVEGTSVTAVALGEKVVLPALVLYDMRAAVEKLEGAVPSGNDE